MCGFQMLCETQNFTGRKHLNYTIQNASADCSYDTELEIDLLGLSLLS